MDLHNNPISDHAASNPDIRGSRRYMSKKQRACDFCRSRKSACQIESAPPCRLCIAHSKNCAFTADRAKRRVASVQRQPVTHTSSGPQAAELPLPHTATTTTNGISPLSQDIGIDRDSIWLENQQWSDLLFTGNEELLGYETGFGSVAGAGAGEQPQESLLPVPSNGISDQSIDEFAPTFLDAWFKGTPQTQTPERSLDQLPDATAQLCGLTGDMDPYVLRRYRFNENAEFGFSKLSIRSVQDTAVPAQFLLSPKDLSSESRGETELDNEGVPSAEDERDTLSSLIPHETGKRLIQLFFKFVYPQFPILSTPSPPDPATSPVHLLASIYCIGQHFASYDDRLCIDYAYRPPSSQALFHIAWKSLNRSMHAPTVETVQAGLILLLRSPANELVLDSAFKWSLLGSVLSTAQTVGLHLDASHWRLPHDELLLRKRLSWAVFAADKWLALSLGRPSHINSSDWLVTELTSEDLEEASSDTWSEATSICLQFSRLTNLLEKVLIQLYSLRAVAKLTLNFQETLKTSKELLTELTNWYQNLDPYFHVNTPDDLSSDPDARFSIHLSYHAIKITILRALLRPFYHAGATPPQDPQQHAEWISAKENCRLGAKTGAGAAIRSASSLRACHYQAFWAPWCKTHFALITNLFCFLAVTSPSEESAAALAVLNQARQVYRVQSRSFSTVRFALLRIDALFWVGFDEVINKNLDDSPNFT